MAGKTESKTGQQLKPENVCFDVTTSVDGSAPDGLPLVFSTGYKMNYMPGGAATLLVKPSKQYGGWWLKLWRVSPPAFASTGIAVGYKNHSAVFKLLNTSPATNPDGSIPNFVPADFDAKGKTYRQLTPDGVLSDK